MKLHFGIIIFFLFIASLASAQQVATPTFDPDGGTLVAIRRVRVHCATPGAIVRYTSNGLEPTEADPVVPPETHVTLDAGCTLKAKAFKAGMEPSETKSAIFTVRVYPLLCMPDGGLCAEPVMLASEPSSTIYYTLDGSEPGPGSPSVPTGGRILVDHPATLKAIAYKDGLLPSYVKTAQYSFRNPVILHVRADGSDQSSGLSWQEAKQTIQAAIDSAVAGDEVWVAAGTYSNVTLRHGIKLYGGFAGWESGRGQRDYLANRTVIDGGGLYRGVVSISRAGSTTVIDGFTIQHGGDSYGNGISGSLASPTIRNNLIANNQGHGLSLNGTPDSFLIANTVITRCEYSAIYLWHSQAGNMANDGLIINNVVVGNLPNSGIAAYRMGARVSNNAIIFNERGVTQYDGGRLTMDHNCVFGNTQYDYSDSNVNGEFPHPTDINVDPLFQDMANGDYRLRWDSPCIDAGTNEGAPTTDIEGRVRPMDGNHDGIAIADIGAYESPMPVAVDVLHDTIRLQPNKLVQVAILSDPVFNALSVDPKTVVFGSGNAKEVHGRGHPEDVNGDGLTDLLFHFSCAESGIVPGYQTVFLQGKLMSGEDIVGADGVMGIPR